jgi:integral membrane protein
MGLCEGCSYLVLLLVAMPLKYIWAMPLGVRIVGAVHGVLFLLYVALAFRAARANSWQASKLVRVLVASVLPCGPFVIDRSLRAETA